MSGTEEGAMYTKGRVMHRGKTQGTAIVAGFIMAGALVLGLPLPSQAASEQSFAGKTRAPLDPRYADNMDDYQLKMDVKWRISLSPWVDADFLHIHVKDGVVTLRGVVEDEAAAASAVRNAKAAGAKEVINKLTTETGK